MTIRQMIKKANNCFVWVEIYDGDGEYLRVSKSALIHPFIKNFDKKKFVLRTDGDLYVN